MSTAQRVLHGDFGRIALLDMDKPLVRHVHSECHLLLKALGADTCFSVREVAHELSDTTAILINAGEPHYYAHKPDSAPTLILALYIEPRWLAERHESLRTSAHPAFFPDPCVTLTTDMRRVCDALIAEMLVGDSLPREQVENLLFDLLILIFERHSEWHHLRRHLSNTRASPVDARIRHANDYMLAHIGDDIDMGELAREVGLSRAHFFALYRQHTLITPQMFLNMQKMRRACTWLATHHNGSIGNLSEWLGFSEQGHFTRFFRKHLGAAPGQYRRVLDSYDSERGKPLPDNANGSGPQ